MPDAPTPLDMSYSTPSVFDPQSPCAQQIVARSPILNVDVSANQKSIQSIQKASELQNQALFLVSPEYVPASPLPPFSHGPSTPLASVSFQSPPGMPRYSDSLWAPGSMDVVFGNVEVAIVTSDSDICETKCERLIELVRKTEETMTSNYEEDMLEVNSLVYYLITYDHSRSQAIRSEYPAAIPPCYVCNALNVIGVDKMAAKVESERILLEAIAVSEGRLGEEHPGSLHFRIKLLWLYENWKCRDDSVGAVLLRIMYLVLVNCPSVPAAKLLSNLLDLPYATERKQCGWLQPSSWGPFLNSSSHDFSSLLIRDPEIQDSPRNIWEMISVILLRILDFEEEIEEETKFGLIPFLEFILHQGLESVDGPRYFWMATFVAVLFKLWPVISTSKQLLNGISDNVPGSKAVKASLGKLLENPYRLEPSAAAADSEPSMELGDVVSATNDRNKFDDISMLRGPLENLEELRVVLAEVSLSELERLSHRQPIPNVDILNARQMHSLLCDAARLGNSNLIQQLAKLWDLDIYVGEYKVVKLPLYLATEAGHSRAVEAILNAGADPDGPEDEDEGLSPLGVAVRRRHDDIVLLLLKRGAKACFFDLPDIFAASNQEIHEKCLEVLQSRSDFFVLLFSLGMVGAYERYTVLDMVSEFIREGLKRTQNSLPKIKAILHFLQDPDDRWCFKSFLDREDENGRGLELVLHALAGVHIEQQAREILKTILVGSEDDIDKMLKGTGPSESPALHTLVSRNAPNALNFFLDLDPYLEALDSQGNTALHVAAARKRTACAQQLLQAGIDLDLENDGGETALGVAVRAGHLEIESLIFAHMALGGGDAARE